MVESGLIGLDWPGFRDPKAVQRRFDTDSYLGGGNSRLRTHPDPLAGLVTSTYRRYQRQRRQDHKAGGLVSYTRVSKSSRQACSQRRQASVQTRQCGMWTCRSHSSPQLRQIATQASSSGRVRLAS